MLPLPEIASSLRHVTRILVPPSLIKLDTTGMDCKWMGWATETHLVVMYLNRRLYLILRVMRNVPLLACKLPFVHRLVTTSAADETDIFDPFYLCCHALVNLECLCMRSDF